MLVLGPKEPPHDAGKRQQSEEIEEHCTLRAAKAGRSSNMCFSSPNDPVLRNLQTRLLKEAEI